MKVLWFQMWYLIFERRKNGTDVEGATTIQPLATT